MEASDDRNRFESSYIGDVIRNATKSIARKVQANNQFHEKLRDMSDSIHARKSLADAERKKLKSACMDDMQAMDASCHAANVFSGVKHALECKESHELIETIGGVDKLRQLKNKYDAFKERKLDPNQLDYNDVLSRLSIFEGSLVLMAWDNGAVSFLRTSKQGPDARSPSDISFEVVFCVDKKRAAFITFSFDTAKAFVTPVSGKNVKELFTQMSHESNIKILFDSKNKLLSKMSLSKYSQSLIQQTRDAIEGVPGLAGSIDKCPNSETVCSGLDRLANTALGDDEDCQIVGSMTLEDRNHIGWLNAISVD